MFLQKTTQQDKEKDAIGMVVASKGRACIISPDGTERSAFLEEIVRVGDTLRTLDEAFLQVTYIDGSYHQLSNNNELTINA